MNLLLENFDLVAKSPDGIAQLRKLILELAVRGKLVLQDPKDEPVSVLLAKIKAEKTRLVKEGKIKAGKELGEISEEDKPYDLPEGWQWVRLGMLADQVNGKAFKPSDWVSIGIPIVRIQNLNDRQAAFNYCSEDVVESKYIISTDQILISWSGTPGTSFGAFRWKRGKAALNQHINRVVLFGDSCFDKDYFVIMVNAQLDVLIGAARGAVGLRHVTMGQLDNLCVALPPLAEQSRIVSRVQELMQVLDTLEARSKESEGSRSRALLSATRSLPQQKTSRELVCDWGRLSSSLDSLVRRPEDVKALRSLVLELAVRGKLVPQDANEESTSVLLSKIKAEKTRLVKEGKIKAGKELPEIGEEEKPYELPEGWAWVRIRDVTYDWGQCIPKSDFTYIDVASIDNTVGKLSDCLGVISANEAPSRARKRVKAGTVIYSTVRPYLLNTAVIRGSISPEPIASTAFAVLHPFSMLDADYLHYYLRSQPFTDYVSEKMIGMAYPAINDAQFSLGVVPLPPFAEQSHIVSRVQELMKVLDRLEEGLRAQERVAQSFAEAAAKVG